MQHLKQLQHRFKKILGGQKDEACSAQVVNVDRLFLYQENQTKRLLSSFLHKYKKTHNHLGDVLFKEAVLKYAHEHPMESPCLCAYGKGLDAYITGAGHEIAHMEWAMNESLLGFQTQPSLPSIKALSTGADYHIVLKAGIQLMTSYCDLKKIWLNRETAGSFYYEKGIYYFLVAAHAQQSFFIEVSQKEYGFLGLLKSGVSFDAIQKAGKEDMLKQFQRYCTFLS